MPDEAPVWQKNLTDQAHQVHIGDIRLVKQIAGDIQVCNLQHDQPQIQQSSRNYADLLLMVNAVIAVEWVFQHQLQQFQLLHKRSFPHSGHLLFHRRQKMLPGIDCTDQLPHRK